MCKKQNIRVLNILNWQNVNTVDARWVNIKILRVFDIQHICNVPTFKTTDSVNFLLIIVNPG